jgi:hypothetical protein
MDTTMRTSPQPSPSVDEGEGEKVDDAAYVLSVRILP